MKQIYFLTVVLGLSLYAQALTLDEAIELARENSPELRAARLNSQSAEQALVASGLWNNPTLKLRAEGVGGDLDATADAEYVVSLQQTFERGAKRKGRREIARQAAGAASMAAAEKELTLLARVREAFIDVLSQQETGKIRAEQEALGRAFVDVAEKRREAGGGSELEVAQAELSLEEILLSQTCCFGDLAAARQKLASLIGMPEKEMGELSGSYFQLDSTEGGTLAESHPALQRLKAEVSKVRAQAALDGMQDATGIKLEAGYKHEAAEDVNTFVVGAWVPLNFVRSGRARQVATLTRANAMEAQVDELRRSLRQRLSVLTALYSGSKIEAEMTRDRLIPKAEQTYELSRAGYEAGRFSWFELIAAQQQLAEIKIRYIDALKDAHFAWAQITKFMTKEI